MDPLLEAVPNFSEGRDPAFVTAVVAAMEGAGAEVLDASSDPDHHRTVVTAIGRPAAVEAALIAAAAVALERIDLRVHDGVHPRVGALDVAPVVALAGTDPETARASARRVGEGIADLGIPVWWYAASSSPPGRALAELRRGGFEALVRDGVPTDRPIDLAAGRTGPHPTAGVSCVGARPLLLAWNVDVDGIGLDALREVARGLRASGGGFPGLRALGLELRRQGRLQLSMNLENVEERDPMAVFEAIEHEVGARGGRVLSTEVIGMIPDGLMLPAATRRLRLLDAASGRMLSARAARHLASRGGA